MYNVYTGNRNFDEKSRKYRKCGGMDISLVTYVTSDISDNQIRTSGAFWLKTMNAPTGIKTDYLTRTSSTVSIHAPAGSD